jgi:hypothetical protein
MAREHAQIKLAMWADDDFRALSIKAQHLYFVLLTSPSLSYCGVADWRPKRLAAMAASWTAQDVEGAAADLEARQFVFFSEDTEEALVRSFVRNDGLMARERMGIAMAKAHAAVASSRLRGLVVNELNRLHESHPDLESWKSERVTCLLSKASVEPPPMAQVMPLPTASTEQSGTASVMPLGMASGEPSGMAQPIDTLDLPPTTAPSPAPSSLLLPASPPPTDRSTRKKPAKPLPDDWGPTGQHRAFVAEHGLDLDNEVYKFRNHAKANDKRQVNWTAAFSTWLGNARDWRPARQKVATGALQVWAEE